MKAGLCLGALVPDKDHETISDHLCCVLGYTDAGTWWLNDDSLHKF